MIIILKVAKVIKWGGFLWVSMDRVLKAGREALGA
jgi:hypothetical protein